MCWVFFVFETGIGKWVDVDVGSQVQEPVLWNVGDVSCL